MNQCFLGFGLGLGGGSGWALTNRRAQEAGAGEARIYWWGLAHALSRKALVPWDFHVDLKGHCGMGCHKLLYLQGCEHQDAKLKGSPRPMRLPGMGARVLTLGSGGPELGTECFNHCCHCQHLLPNACISKGKLNRSVFVN